MESKTRKDDRRVQRTEKLLGEALIQEMLEKGYDAVTVQDIIDRANVGRSTFYAHYLDKEDLLMRGFERLFKNFEVQHQETLQQEGDLKTRIRLISRFFFLHVESHRHLYKALTGKRGSDLIIRKIHHHITGLLEERLLPVFPVEYKGDVPPDAVIAFLLSSLVGLLAWWLNNELPYTGEQVFQMYDRLAIEPLPTR